MFEHPPRPLDHPFRRAYGRAAYADERLNWFGAWIGYAVRHFVVGISILAAVIALLVDLNDREEERLIRAWNVIASTPSAGGNVGQKRALQFLADKGEALNDINAPKAYLAGIDLAGRNLIGGNLAGANLFDADLSGASLRDIDLSNADLSNANLFRANLSDANLSGTDLYGAKLNEAVFVGADFAGANFHRPLAFLFPEGGADLSGAVLWSANFSGVDLFSSDLSNAAAGEADFSGATLSRVDFSGANLEEANLVGADLSNAQLTGANLDKADLAFADVSLADFADVRGRPNNLFQTCIRRGSAPPNLPDSWPRPTEHANCGEKNWWTAVKNAGEE